MDFETTVRILRGRALYWGLRLDVSRPDGRGRVTVVLTDRHDARVSMFTGHWRTALAVADSWLRLYGDGFNDGCRYYYRALRQANTR